MSRWDALLPGDQVKWVYRQIGEPVDDDEELWSSSMRTYMPIGRPTLLISIILPDVFVWLVEGRLFETLASDDESWRPETASPSMVEPRALNRVAPTA